MPSFDRGFIKWQPFESLISSKEVLNDLEKKKKVAKPTLFPEEKEHLNQLLKEAYFMHSLIVITFFKDNKIYKIKTIIKKVNKEEETIKLEDNKVLAFEQILDVKIY